MVYKMKLKQLLLLSSVLITQPLTVLAASDLTLVWQQDNNKVEDVQWLNSSRMMPSADRLVIYKGKGLQLEDKQGRNISLMSGDFSDIDHRDINNGLLVAILDDDRQQAFISSFNYHIKAWSERHYLPVTDYKIEAVCLYQDKSKHAFLFLIGEDGQAEQWLVADASQALSQAKLIRQLSTPPQSQYCQVDDAQSLLFINEENVGIWAYDAHAEADLTRQIVGLTKPFGHIGKSAMGMHRVPGGLLVLDADDNKLHIYLNNQGQWLHNSALSLTGLSEPDKLTVKLNNEQLEILIRHDDGMSMFTLAWPYKEPVHQAAIVEVEPQVETKPVTSLGDAADDPAIWVNLAKPQHSRVLGTDKQSGLVVYDLSGKQLQHLAVGRLNNVDIRTDFNLNGRQLDIAVASNRDNNSLHIFGIHTNTGVVSELAEIGTAMEDIYGLCMFKNNSGDIYAIANDKNGQFFQYLITGTKGQVKASLVRQFHVDSQPEGCVADDVNNRLFIGEEDQAVWTLDARPEIKAKLEKVISVGNNIHSDIEGISLYNKGRESYLIISSQGNNSYVVLNALPPFTYRGAFQIGFNTTLGIDGVSETDGLDVTSVNLGPLWQDGMLVVQDGRNRMPADNQNFKYVPWSDIADQLELN
ncbi:MAG: 3-phytase [Gammaproteobacteria bacterium]|nr:MAG: 3-phytase [Gammaproteobacteria bacterium]